MATPRNHKIERSSSDPKNMSASWDLSHQAKSGDLPETFSVRNFHIYRRNVDSGAEARDYTVPPNDTDWTDSGQSSSNIEVIYPSHMYPNTRWRLSKVQHHCYGTGGAWYDNLSVVEFGFSEPLPPKLTLTRNDLKLTWKIDANASEMSNTSRYYRTDTQYWVQSITFGQSWASYNRYRMPSATGTFTGSSSEYEYTSMSTYTPSKPTRVRLLAMNRGPSGASAFASEEHVYAQVNTPTISVKSIRTSLSDNVTAFQVNPNSDSWHPVDHIILQRQKASEMSTSGSWEDVVDIADVAGNVRLMTDETAAQVPDEDQATFWRVMTWHDNRQANASYGYPEGQPLLANNPKAPTDVAATINNDESDDEYGFITATWSSASACSPEHIVELWGKRSADGVMERIESKTIEAGEDEAVFEKDYSSLTMYCVRVQAYKDWSPTQKRSSDWAESATMATVSINEVRMLEDGTSVYVDESHDDDDADFTEYSWHTRGDGWASTEDPKTYNRVSTGSASHVSIVGLEEGVEYYIQARRYNSKTSTYGPYSAQVSTMSGSTPGTPTLIANGRVASGGVIEYEWDFPGRNQTAAMLYLENDTDRVETFAGDGTTTEFTLAYLPDALPTVKVDNETATVTLSNQKITFSTAPSNGAVIEASYKAPAPLTTIGIDGDEMACTYDVDESLEGSIIAYVKVTCGGNWSDESYPVTTEIVQPPTCTVAAAGTLTANSASYGGYDLTALPLSVTLGGTATLFDVTVTCFNGTSLPKPNGVERVAAGSVVAVATNCSSGTSVIVPERGPLVGGGQYDITVVGKDPSTGAKSEPATLSFTVDWSTGALMPTATVTVDGSTAIINVTADSESPETDRLDIWRKTADGAVLCAADAAFDKDYTDSVPPYGWEGNAYLAQITSIDGDTVWLEVPYTLRSNGVTVNWGEKSVNLPWNIEMSNNYASSFEARVHMDGSRVGYWQKGVDRTASVSGDLRKEEDADTIDAFMALGRHDGISFVRAPGGIAFACNVDVDMSKGYGSSAVPVTLDITEVDDDGTWRARAEADED